ncbi:MAG: MopE-related protein [Desulfobacterales bacterium]|jgi:fibronectin type 3 domain-containing protein|nr:MopE-related protein [Desulfobacterales bacterium]
MYGLKKTKLFSIFLLAAFLGLIVCGCNSGGGGGGSSDSANSTATETTWYKDADKDGYGDPNNPLEQQSKPQGYVDNNEDCDDYDADTHPGALEICDGKDNNCNGQSDENACDIKDIQISGVITNLEAAEKYITQDSYLQIVPFPADGDMDFSVDAKGRTVYTSDLAEIDFPSTDSFNFEIVTLPPGRYVIAAQMLEPYEPGSDANPVLSKTQSKLAQITIPDEYAAPLAVELGNVFIPVPEAETPNQNTNSAPSTPTGVSATDGDYTDKIRVTWNASAGAASYEIFRADSFMGSKSKIGSTSGTVYDDKSTPCNVDFYYWVKAKSASGTSEFFYNDLGYRKCPAPPAPENINASNGQYSDYIRISWNPAAGADSYDIYRAMSSGEAPKKIASTPDTSYDDMTAVCPNTYYYSVKAINSDGGSEFSVSDSGSKDCSDNPDDDDDSPQIDDLPVPTAVSASDGTFLEKIQVTWSASSGATSYDVYRSYAECDEKIKLGTTSATVYDDETLHISDRHTYYYWVKAKTTEGNSEFSRFDTGYLMRKPPKPTGVNASDGLYVGMIRVTWNPTPTAASYEIYRCRRWNCTQVTKIGESAGASFDDTDHSCYTEPVEHYVYYVKAVNPAGKSEFSDDDYGYVYPTLPPPINITASDGSIDCCVKITWASICDECHVYSPKIYEIYRATSPEGQKTKVGSVEAGCCPTYSFRDSTVTCPNIYYYWVKSVDANGVGSCFFGNYDSGFCSGCTGD